LGEGVSATPSTVVEDTTEADGVEEEVVSPELQSVFSPTRPDGYVPGLLGSLGTTLVLVPSPDSMQAPQWWRSRPATESRLLPSAMMPAGPSRSSTRRGCKLISVDPVIPTVQFLAALTLVR